ncbi:MAG: glucan biosynthesis protein [Phenylobacterium sp.]|uniref:glucan biosynthesis protein n=1 Tax=Phenylobacterium sp. TaxID=1871053 RepID=UPI0039193FCB
MRPTTPADRPAPRSGLPRRQVLAAVPLALAAGPALAATAGGFGLDDVAALARARARRPYRAPAADLPAALAALSYDAYRDIRFAPDHALWADEGLPFRLQFFHRGGFFKDRVDLYEVRDGRPVPIAYAPERFTFGREFPSGPPQGLRPDLGFAGFRIHAPINRPDYFDEVAVFLGASYFRAVARDMHYGLSARGLAIGAGAPGEEFPVFRTFWIERPGPDATALTVHALMDSPSLAGAYRFVIRPGVTTVFDVSARLFPRAALDHVGVAPLTSMFLYGVDPARRFDDFRPQVHDSDTLLMANGAGERLIRPLANPAHVQTSAFADRAPQGFGLLQRERDFSAYQDLEARYEARPSLWVEPRGNWGAGEVRLVELPSRSEADDNIGAFWTPARPLAAGREAAFDYRLHWGPDPAPATALARLVDWRTGAGGVPGGPDPGARRRFVLDFSPLNDGGLAADVVASAGAVSQAVLHPNPKTGGQRLSFEFDPAGAPVSELRAQLRRSGTPCSEVWLYRWLA